MAHVDDTEERSVLVWLDAALVARAMMVLEARGAPHHGGDPSAENVLRAILERISNLPEAWTCDVCRRPIQRASDGQLEWVWDGTAQRARDMQLVHTAEGSPRPHLHVASRARPSLPRRCGHGQVGPTEELLRIPLHHLTDDDGLMQLLEQVAAGRLPRAQVLKVIQRLHLPHYEAARPLLDDAIRAGIIVPNLPSAGFHWQGDLVEVLRHLSPKRAPAARRLEAGPPTLEEHLRALDRSGGVPARLSEALGLAAEAGLAIADLVRRAPLSGVRGGSGAVNVHGEEVKPLDRLAADVLLSAFRRSSAVAGVASEEHEGVIAYEGHEEGSFVIAFDPLDGSDNLESGMSVGSIFSVVPRSRRGPLQTEDFLRAGREQAAAGYLLYGAAVILVLAVGGRASMFVLDPDRGRFVRTCEALKAPDVTAVLSVNDANARYWPTWMTAYVAALVGRNADTRRLVSRFVGTLVADVHRNLVRGGITAVPEDQRRPQGKLRLLYECSPLAMVIEASGGAASDGRRAILDIEPASIHQRTPFIAGSASDVALAERLAREAERPDRQG
ncbi:class 1 fructose-bisphosphatase [Polyangium mundeleinium]|uniref:Fructose-1,6-bisphosphatase class 1 n=1 Tax=Polyangium mundeleinium TaxID=2995306 RepID=A0ABT5EM65_9BACT|nr:class 1 fructose-bisphosphatase [Polyangium mundeleinium]MDC0742935.1 fructose-1,6-bisphosphatase [Polyangium mundeleinium]